MFDALLEPGIDDDVVAYAGIDPGIHGAIAYLRNDGLVLIEDLPTVSIATVRTRHDKIADPADPTAPPIRDPTAKARHIKGQKSILNLPLLRHGLLRLQRQHGLQCVALEKVGPMPRDGAIQAFAFGNVAGEIRGLMVGLGLPYLEVSPQAWKPAFKLTKDKTAARMAAMSQWPQAQSRLLRVKDDGRAEALWLAAYAKRMSSV